MVDREPEHQLVYFCAHFRRSWQDPNCWGLHIAVLAFKCLNMFCLTASKIWNKTHEEYEELNSTHGVWKSHTSLRRASNNLGNSQTTAIWFKYNVVLVPARWNWWNHICRGRKSGQHTLDHAHLDYKKNSNLNSKRSICHSFHVCLTHHAKLCKHGHFRIDIIVCDIICFLRGDGLTPSLCQKAQHSFDQECQLGPRPLTNWFAESSCTMSHPLVQVKQVMRASRPHLLALP